MSNVTFIIPVAPYHQHRVQDAIASVEAQTVPCVADVVMDVDGRGPGWARNIGLSRATTRFVSFLDADDRIAPTFAAETIQAWRAGRYVYTDWLNGEGKHVKAPNHNIVWSRETFHIITTLLLTEDAQRVRFDETLPAHEDVDYYLNLWTSGVCGWHLPQPLFDYRPGGLRSLDFMSSDGFKSVKAMVRTRYEGVNLMACCGSLNQPEATPVNEAQPGDILVLAAWGGNRRERGPVTGRNYPYTGNYAPMYVAEADMRARPDLWRPVRDGSGPTRSAIPVSAQEAAERVFGGGIRKDKPTTSDAGQPDPDFDAFFEAVENA